MTKEDLIEKLKNINIYDYFIRGGVSSFNKHHPNTIEYINIYTAEIQSYCLNKTLPAKLIYLTKYDGVIENITDNNNIMIYDRNLKDFKIANINAAKKHWENYKKKISSYNNFYSKKETINYLKNNYTKYFGKSGNRKLIRDNEKLYLSVYYHTKEFDNLNLNINKFTFRLYCLINNISIFCEKHHNKVKNIKMKNGNIIIKCGSCEPKYPSKEWYMKKYNKDWEHYMKKRKTKLKKIRTNSKKWFIDKYGKIEGNKLFEESVIKKIDNIIQLKKNRYSKISQILFWSIHYKLKNVNNIYFQELNNEYIIRIPKKYNYENTIMVVDFIQNNKIIEYNGKYWHDTKKDIRRYNILNKMGYETLLISSDDFNRNKKNEKIINKCIDFLNNDN